MDQPITLVQTFEKEDGLDLGLAGQVVLVTGAVSLGLVETENFDAHAGGTDPERLAKLTAAYPLRRLGLPSDVPPVVLLLASPLTSWVTGQVLSVNGGYAMV